VALKRHRKPVCLSHGDEEILKAVHFYRYMTALDIAHLLYSPTSLRRVRDILARLCGGADFQENQYLYRFRMPSVEAGNPERIYTMGNLGRDFLSRELGFSVNRHVRSSSGAHLSFSQVVHNLVLTRVLVAAQTWASGNPDISISAVRICYEFGGSVTTVDIDEMGKREKVSVVPDAWLLFEKLENGKVVEHLPLLLEIDRGTMYRQRLKRHVLSRIEFVRSGEYRRVFGTEAVVIAYVATGVTGEAHEGRRMSLCSWTMEALKDTRREDWASVFRFCSVSLDKIYMAPLFDEDVWYRPDLGEPVGLFGE
jgi:hypothetical protein